MSAGEYGHTDGTGRVLAGRYRVTEQLGRGGMGVVWKAVDEVLGREVAVKELRTYTDAAGPELAGLGLRMQREARAAARVRHPGVVAVHDVAEADGRPLIVMELIDGPSLDDVLRERGTLDPRAAAGIGAQVMDALAAAHRAGVLHRDVKPANILLDRSGRTVLTDFGIAAMDDPGDGVTTRLTRSGEIVGSLDYLSPERAQGTALGPASDVWALGATLYAAVEGDAPFRRTSAFTTLTAIVTEPLPESRRAGPLAPVLRRLMDKRPEHRPTAEEARALLEAVADATGADVPAAPLRGPAAPLDRAGTERGVPATPPDSGPPRPPGAGATATGPGAGGAHVAPGTATSDGAAASPAGPRRRGRALLAAVAVTVALAATALTVVVLDSAGGTRAGARTGDTRTGDTRTDATATASAAPATTPSASTGDDGGSTTPAPACRPAGGGRYDCRVGRTATSYTDSGTEAGVLNAGTNYFYCQQNLGRRETYREWTNVWWARTDDDSGNTGVWVSVVYVAGGDNDRPVPGLPVC